MKTQLLALLGGLVCLTGLTPTASADTTTSPAERVSDLSHHLHRVWVHGHYSHHGGHRHWVPGHWHYYR